MASTTTSSTIRLSRITQPASWLPKLRRHSSRKTRSYSTAFRPGRYLVWVRVLCGCRRKRGSPMNGKGPNQSDAFQHPSATSIADDFRTDLGNARRLTARHGNDIHYVSE